MNRRKKLEHKKPNFCCTFVLPMCGVNYKNLPSNFVNGYISLDYKAYLIFDKTEDYDVVYHHYQEHLKDRNKNVLDILDYEDEIVIVFNVPEKHKKDFDLFIIGKYSKFDEDYKEQIGNYFGKKSISDTYVVTEYNTIHPQPFKRKLIAERLFEKKDLAIGLKILEEVGEVLDPPDMNKEIYKTITELTDNKKQETEQL